MLHVEFIWAFWMMQLLSDFQCFEVCFIFIFIFILKSCKFILMFCSRDYIMNCKLSRSHYKFSAISEMNTTGFFTIQEGFL